MWSLTSDHVVASLHVILLKESDFMRVSAAIKRTLLKFGVESATIQPEYISEIDVCCFLISGLPSDFTLIFLLL